MLVFVLLVLFVGLVGTGWRLGRRLHLALLRRRLRRGFLAGGRALGTFGSCSRRVAIGGFVARLSNDPKKTSVESASERGACVGGGESMGALRITRQNAERRLKFVHV